MTEILDKLKELNDKLTERIIIDPALFEGIVDSIPDGLLVVDENGIIQFCNEQIELMFGWKRTELIGRPVHMLLPQSLRDKHAAHLARYFSNPQRRPMNLAQTLAGEKRNGKSIDVQIVLGPVVSTQGILGLAVVRRVVDGS